MTLHFGLLVFPQIQQLDLTGPYEVFASTPGIEVHLVWKNLGPLRASTGLALAPTTTFAACPKLDLLCVPGGGGVNALLEDAEVLDFVRASAATARYVTSVCTGSLVLGAAGLLRGRRATSHWNALDFLPRFGAEPVRERVVRDGPLITAGGITSGIDFGLTVVGEIMGREEAEAVQLMLEYDPQPPFGSGAPQTAPDAVIAEVRRRFEASRRAREDILDRICG